MSFLLLVDVLFYYFTPKWFALAVGGSCHFRTKSNIAVLNLQHLCAALLILHTMASSAENSARII